jgi:hypothetical protein
VVVFQIVERIASGASQKFQNSFEKTNKVLQWSGELRVFALENLFEFTSVIHKIWKDFSRFRKTNENAVKTAAALFKKNQSPLPKPISHKLRWGRFQSDLAIAAIVPQPVVRRRCDAEMHAPGLEGR